MSEVRGWQAVRKMEQGQWGGEEFCLTTSCLSTDRQLAEDQLVRAGCYSDLSTECYWSDFFWLRD